MVIIIGAGLSGLLTAYRLKQQGIAFKILEARDRVGGRIHTVLGKNETPVEMGATWFGNHHQHVIALLEELGIGYFEQYMKGTVFFQPMSTSPAQSIQVPSQPPSYRISGGTSHLINTLYNRLDAEDVVLNQEVQKISFHTNSVEVVAADTFTASKVILAIPPKIWSIRIAFEPQLPMDLLHTAQLTHTWMEDSIKVAITYAQPFWEQEQHSGTLFSNTGPLTEFYDQCNYERSKYALCGFMSTSFKQLDDTERRNRVINQLQSVFGAKAADYVDYKECIWSRENLTYTDSETPLFPHQNNGAPIFRDSFFEDRLLICGAETASEFPGYMDGAVSSANRVASKIVKAKS
ncbi:MULTISPECIES: FAD-dependent oxidoreductase [unclassified Leeuwenhoekiella]|uniref:flavin monoamine oxidase family protein n=1 Tax=unclassified Leeuwenhoekiella TaxID=2615029 RepID=UPI000C556AD6|nr:MULTISPECIES: FAD-dependent oxidoreductase [unclassified Leeuwenhoekiella]MAW93627.1 amine oxidase [Leeuwenhoekiella sp.]MBA80370.1 amine oxidase [Leeuwenhoekiella sp.]|tara:strand:- start:14828 stop:15874 length:1047 start_codon:yes stop_codon:yes gene_type:complete